MALKLAKHINPLSELPGNVLLEKSLEECLNGETACRILYFDMNNFKAYNDVYGFENGDIFIKCFAQLLKNDIAQEENFIGHIGGDDFMAIIREGDAEELCRKITKEFDQSVLKFYNKNDLDRGYITTSSRRAQRRIFRCCPLRS